MALLPPAHGGVIFAQIFFELGGSPFRELEGRAAIPNSSFSIYNSQLALLPPTPGGVIFAQILFELGGSPFRELEGRAAIQKS